MSRAPVACVYDVVHQSADQIVIRDVGHCQGKRTVTNDVDAVVAHLHRTGLLGNRRLLYYDSQGALDEIEHDGAGHFLGFAPGPGRA